MSAAMGRLKRAELERFRSVLARRTGLMFDDTKTGILEDILARQIASDGSAAQYLARLEGGDAFARGTSDPLEEIVAELTVGETYFFRHMDQLRAFSDVALDPALYQRGKSTLSVLSAGCSTGEEPYSLAMLARERLPAHVALSIRAVDINAPALARARAGEYSTWSLRETPRAMVEKWFRERGRDVSLHESIREMVRFEQRNLALDDADLWCEASYDVVFCRNMMMYFAPERARDLVARIRTALKPGGFLFVGSAETLRDLSTDYLLRHTQEAFFYERKPAALSTHPRGVHTPSATLASPPDPAVAAQGGAATWMDTVQRASARIQALAEASTAVSGESQRTKGTPDLKPALELLRSERFADALSLLGALVAAPHERPDPETLLLRAALLIHSGAIGDGERACHELLAVDDLNAGAHYLLALCRESASDLDAAREHDEMASHLDPAFAMPRLHHGLLSRRSGDSEGARRELGCALSLLEREEPARLVLFGGGFTREALIALCRAELDRVPPGDVP